MRATRNSEVARMAGSYGRFRGVAGGTTVEAGEIDGLYCRAVGE